MAGAAGGGDRRPGWGALLHFDDPPAGAGRGFELVLAGHAHGGQWRLPGLLNGLFAPDQGLFPTYAGGRYALGDTTLLVSRGLARESTRLPRFYNRPELVMVELRPGLEEFPAKKE